MSAANAKTPRGRKPVLRKKPKKGQNPTQTVEHKPSRCKTALNQGIYISPSRVKYCLDANGINSAIENAIDELRNAEPHEVDLIDSKTKKKTGTQTTTLIAFDKLSEETRSLVTRARTQNDEREKENAKREKIKADKLAEDIKAGRVDANALAEERKVAEEAEIKRQEERVIRDAERKAKKQPVRGPKKITKYSNEVELLSKMRIRFAKDSAIQVAASIDAALHELMEFGMTNVLKQNRKILKRRHLLQPGYEQLSLACLYRNLDVFKWAQDNETKRQEEEAKKKDEKKNETKDEKKDETKDEKKGEESEDDETTVSDDDDRPSFIFGHYIKQICHNIMNQHLDGWVPKDAKDKNPYEDIRVGQEIREFGNQLIMDFSQRLCPLLKGQIAAMGVKTISQSVIKQTINFMLEYAGVNSEVVNTDIDSKIAKYTAAVLIKKEEKAKAAAEKEAKKAVEAAVTEEKQQE